MCGIAGIFNYADPDRPVDRELLVRMTRVLEHRGPDGEGFHVDGPVGLGHRRLSIVDLTPTGHQPMPNKDHSGWITYNGELYNHGMFRRRLLSKGHPFRGTSDTETLLHLMEEEGPDALRDALGIFAFAYWDGSRRQLTLARDQLGVKQLYYYDDGRRIIFGSEIKAVLECSDVPRELDPEAINQYLHFHTTLFDRTFFKQIKQLRAGEYIQISRARVRRKTYWRLENFEPHRGTPEVQVAELRELLVDVVGDQLMSDVPVGSFFSGGIDSSAVAAMASRTGKPPTCFGVHFTNQGVVDERPFQESAARALGLDLHVITLDGSTFPEDLLKLIYHQDQPVIGPAMFPMYMVSRLASKHVKVCLGGQAADEVFGGYARYGLAQPWQVMKSWFAKPPVVNGNGGGTNGGATRIGGNLWLQIADRQNLQRLVNNASNIVGWQARYFDHFAKVPESDWTSIVDVPELVSRRRCYETFQETIKSSPARSPAEKVMHWDMQTYLTGLFHQDDRMSMACGLESRVPLADPRLVQFAFRSGFDLKFRAGATKWMLRQAVADVLPEFVLNRRKIGFDTPAEMWMKRQHSGFLRDLLLSSEARSRGIWNSRELEKLLDNPDSPGWFDVIWKATCIEAWAKTFLAAPSPAPQMTQRYELGAEASKHVPIKSVRDALQELRELGVGGTVFRATWEIKMRTGLGALIEPAPPESHVPAAIDTRQLAFGNILKGNPKLVAASMRDRIPSESLYNLEQVALDAAHGRIFCFGRWTADFGRPINWHVNPTNGKRWEAKAHWSQALRDNDKSGDVKLIWELARFPHAYAMARAAAFMPEFQTELAQALAIQIEEFVLANPFGRGVHWSSGQEIAFRLMAWMFSVNVLIRAGEEMNTTAQVVARAAYEGALHIERNLDYAHKAVFNNHLLSEALALYLVGNLLPQVPESERWRTKGRKILEAEAGRQCYSDGGYIQQSHNYHRVAMQIYLWAWTICKASDEVPPSSWRNAMMRSLDFLLAQQNPSDGRLPNYGANDGALPSVLSTCDFSDFRPILQALSVATRGERIYEAGPWDETTAWFLGTEALDAPLRKPARKSVSFKQTGYQVLRGKDPTNFGILRCGTILDRFSQIDMLHVDVWWRGLNVLVDGGSYLYNGPEKWHNHFLRTASHNTIQVDGRDQMLHYRRFKNLYWTRAKQLQFEDFPEYSLSSGEHYGFQRHPGKCVHRRSVLFVKDDLWVVSDVILGNGVHDASLNWLCGEFPYESAQAEGRLTLNTPEGPFSILTLDNDGQLLAGNVVSGQENPPRGWLSRYYGEKRSVPSLAVNRSGALPLTFVSILTAGQPQVEVRNRVWCVTTAKQKINFQLSDGLIVLDNNSQ